MTESGGMSVVGGHLGPQEAGELPGHRGGHHGADVLAGGEVSEPLGETDLGASRIGPRWRGERRLGVGGWPADTRAVLIGPGRLAELATDALLPARVMAPRCSLSPVEFSEHVAR